jgi:hypothetical protein
VGWLRPTLALLVTIAALALVACGGSGDEATVATSLASEDLLALETFQDAIETVTERPTPDRLKEARDRLPVALEALRRSPDAIYHGRPVRDFMRLAADRLGIFPFLSEPINEELARLE